jgi:hypothetical protein
MEKDMKYFKKCARCLIYWQKTACGESSSMHVTKLDLRSIPVLLMIFSLLLHGSLYPQLETLYRSSTIKLETAKTFGSQTDWKSLFYDMHKSLAIGPDGSIFISNNRQHTIFKFSSSGKLIARFGRKGQGPGDLYFPQSISVLDDKYLVVGEYATARRISLFNLDGKFKQVLRTPRNCYSPLALKKNRIAYLSFLNKTDEFEEIKVWVRDVETGKEVLVTSAEFSLRNTIKANNNYTISFENHLGELIIARTSDGNLLVGISNTPDINVYSSQGKLLRSFRLNIKPDPVTSRYIKEFKQDLIARTSEIKAARPYINTIKKASFEKGFANYLPYYRCITVDSEGNILVFNWLDCITHCLKKFQVYSPDGKFCSEVFLDEGEFEVDINHLWNRLVFSNRGIFAFVQLKDSSDVSPRLIKVNVSGGR